MRRTLAIARAEWIHNLRDRRSLFVILVLPVVLLLLYGYGINYDLRDIPFAVWDLSGTTTSRDLVQSFIASGYFRLRHVITHQEDVAGLLDRGDVIFVMVVPPDLAERLGASRPAQVQVLLSGADTTRATVAQGYIEAALLRVSQGLAQQAQMRRGTAGQIPPGFSINTTILYNPSLNSTRFIVPGLIAILLTILAALLTSTAVVREREWGSFETLVTSPVQAPNIMLGKMAPYVVIAFVDVLLSIATGVLVFHVVPEGSVLLLLMVSFLYLLASLSIGMFFSTVFKSQQLAILVTMLTTLLPTTLISGFAFPLRSMPPVLQAVSNLIPATHFLIVIRSIYLKSAGLAVLWPRVLLLALFALALTALAAKRFEKRL
jgi:ABC-2 type transport system permease protein